MADLINMQQTEYDIVQMKLETIHKEILEEEESIKELILELTKIEGGFYVDMISNKIATLLVEMKSGPMTQIESAFQNTEQAVAAFVNAVIDIDVVDN